MPLAFEVLRPGSGCAGAAGGAAGGAAAALGSGAPATSSRSGTEIGSEDSGTTQSGDERLSFVLPVPVSPGSRLSCFPSSSFFRHLCLL